MIFLEMEESTAHWIIGCFFFFSFLVHFLLYLHQVGFNLRCFGNRLISVLCSFVQGKMAQLYLEREVGSQLWEDTGWEDASAGFLITRDPDLELTAALQQPCRAEDGRNSPCQGSQRITLCPLLFFPRMTCLTSTHLCQNPHGLKLSVTHGGDQ